MHYYKWNTWYKWFSNLGLKNFCAICIMHQTSFWGVRNIVHESDCVLQYFRKGIESWYIFPWRIINWHVSQMAKTSFWYTVWFKNSEKIIIRCMFLRGAHLWVVHQNFWFSQPLNYLSCGLVVFIDINIYILTKGRNFKTFLEEN